ncbi:MAG: RNA polymerase sigma factor [Ktedonobacterales bacterium]
MDQGTGKAIELDRHMPLWAQERARLVGLCARLTGAYGAAEDLAQETLLEAWRLQSTLRDPERFSQWLSGIARNVCLRWLRQQRHDALHSAALPQGDGETNERLDGLLASSADLAIELERQELAVLLDQALTALPAETRAVLLAHYIEEAPLAQIAAQLGANTSAVAMRLHRGRLALRRVLTTELRQELAPYALDRALAPAWEETSLWCTTCGECHLLGRYHPDEGELWLRCPACCKGDDEAYLTHTNSLPILGGVKGYRRASARLRAWIDRYYSPNLLTGMASCHVCGRLVHFHKYQLGDDPSTLQANELGLRHYCSFCEKDCSVSLDSLLLASAPGLQFIRQHPRIRTLPAYPVEVEGRDTLVLTFASVADQARLVMVADAETFALLHAYENR